MLRKSIFLPLLALICTLWLLPAGCRTGQAPDQGSPAASAVSEELASGELRVQLTLSSPQISIAEQLQLTLTAMAPEDFTVSLPEFTESVGDFTLTNTTASPKTLTGGRLSQGRTLTLAPFLPGEYTIPAMTVSATDSRHPDQKATVTMPARTIAVTSLLDQNEKDPQLADIYAPLTQPAPTLYYLLAGGAAVMLLCALLYFFWRRSRRQQAPPPPLPPHATALAAIDQLLRDQAAGSDPALFYAGLTGILRHYIEARFGLKAPEQTTEEFLDSLRRSPVFTEEQKALLRDFLSRCDLIKFARLIPDPQEMEAAVVLCRDFIRAGGESRAGTEGAP
ncbi:MAG: DUF4381 family protein [Desulfurivibrio sp.]|jgi:hypothetical protein|nr:MAG: DUF4381 family protein [Desulfurivibrio sp.]